MMAEKAKKPAIRFSGFTDAWEQRELGMVGSFYYGHSCPKWSVTEDATTPCIRYGELYTKFGTIVDRVFSYTSMPSEKLRFSKGTEVLIPRVGEDPMDYNHCTWLSLKGIAIGEMISVFNSDQNPLFMAIMFNATLRQEFAMRVEGGSVTNLYFEKLKNIEVKYPLISEQQKIGQFFQSIDRLITLHQRKYDKLTKIKKSMLEKMFPKNGSNVPEIRFSGFSDAWEQRKLEMLASFSKGSGYSKNDILPAGTPIILYGRLYTKYETNISVVDTFADAKAGSVYSRGGEVIVPASGETAEDISIASVVERKGVILGGDLNIITPNTGLNPTFLALTITYGNAHNDLSRFAQGKSVVHLHNSDLKVADIPYPSEKEQQKIGMFFRGLDQLITLHQRELDRLQKIKKSCLEKMFV